MPNSQLIEAKLHSLALQSLAALVLVVVFVVMGSGFMLWQARAIGAQGKELEAITREAHTALCALKRDIEVRRERTVEFLRENPHGIPGISGREFRRSVENYDGTLRSLEVLTC